MATVIYEENSYTLQENETVLDALLRHGEKPEYGCKKGVCHACLVEGSGDIPAEAQKGLSDDLIAKGFFLACKAQPSNEITVVKRA